MQYLAKSRRKGSWYYTRRPLVHPTPSREQAVVGLFRKGFPTLSGVLSHGTNKPGVDPVDGNEHTCVHHVVEGVIMGG